MFAVDNVEEEDRPMLLTNEPESMPLPDETTQTLRRNGFSIFEVPCLLDNGERTKFLQLENLHKASTVELIERPRGARTHELPRTLPQGASLFPLTHPRPARQWLYSNHSRSQHSELLQHDLFHLLLKTLSRRSAFLLALRGTRVAFSFK